MVTMLREMKNAAAAVSTNTKKESMFARAREALCDGTVNKSQRGERAFSMLVQEIEKRGGKLESVGPETAKMVSCTLCIPAGKAVLTRNVKVGNNNRLDTLLINKVNSLDKRIVDALIGFGMGALNVSFKVQGQDCFYVIRTNGSRACLEENKVNVALALVGAATIAEEMLETRRGKETMEASAPVLLKKAA